MPRLIFSIVSSEKIEVFLNKKRGEKKLAKTSRRGAKKKRELWLRKKKRYKCSSCFDFDLIKNLIPKVMDDHAAIYERSFISFVIWRIGKHVANSGGKMGF